MSNKLIPTIQDLADPDKLHKNDQLKSLLNQPPPRQWVKINKYANNSEYLPIDKVEYLLDKIFQEWKVEVLDYRAIFNSLTVSIRLHYVNPLTGQWMFHDGVGSEELQTSSGSGTLKPDFSNINKGAVEIALPIAKSTAEKNAAKHLGRLFGRDLNRKDTVEFKPTYGKPEASILKAISSAQSYTELDNLRQYCETPELLTKLEQRHGELKD